MRRRRSWAGTRGAVLALVILAWATCLGQAASVSGAATLPPELVALDHKTGELQIASLRFTLQTSVTTDLHGAALEFLKGLGLDQHDSGELTVSPPAVNLALSLFGAPLRLRVVGDTTYLYLARLGKLDHGRPWVRLGPEGLGALIEVSGPHPRKRSSSKQPPPPKQPPPSAPELATPPFTALAKLLEGAHEVRALGPGTVDGQPVTSFLAVLEPSQLQSKAIATAARARVTPHPPRLRQPARSTPTATLEVSLASSGLPVRTVIAEHEPQVSISATLEIPAVNFPLTIAPPPASETISVPALRKLERKTKKRAHRDRS